MTKLLHLQVVTCQSAGTEGGSARYEVGYSGVNSIAYNCKLDLILISFEDGVKVYCKTQEWQGISFKEETK
ncbi:hypothetical protein MO219_000055 [Listeria monocytogenes]|nr:hypothetical protein [Listeria monocytogenes]